MRSKGNHFTYDQYYAKFPEKKPKLSPDTSTGNRTINPAKPTQNSITNPNHRPTHLDLSGCHGGQLEFVEYLWIYTGTCDSKNSLIATQDFTEHQSSSIAKRSAEREREIILHMRSAFMYSPQFAKKMLILDQLKNKHTAQHIFAEARQNSHIMQFLQGLIDACADELTSMLDLVMHTAKMLGNCIISQKCYSIM